MKSPYSRNLWSILACPHCGHALHEIPAGAICSVCDTNYHYTDSHALDLRLQTLKKHPLEFELGTPIPPEFESKVKRLPKNSTPEVDFSGAEIPHHLTKEVLSHFPKAKTKESLVLDLGCGSGVHRDVCEHAGFEYVSLDYNSPKAMILGDAHALPFADNSFEFILSIAVLEHIRFPFVAMREAYRVLKPGGRLIGSVAFLEPFHSKSFYHHTHLGVFNSLSYAGFNIDIVAPSKEWSVLIAQSKILFIKMPRSISKCLVLPLQFLHQLWWRLLALKSRFLTEETRILYTTGAFTFIASKE